MQKRWMIASSTVLPDAEKKFPELPSIAVQLLANRGLTTQEAIDEFFHPDYHEDIHDPFAFRDMSKAVETIHRHIADKHPIVVHGDYDADGVCAAVLLTQVLKDLGATVDVYLPHRETEGYSLNLQTVSTLADRGTKLIITADCGISNKVEIAAASERGIDVIVTDHHTQPPDLPTTAAALLHPHLEGETYPFKNLAGGGVAWKLAQALTLADHGEKLPAGYEKWLLDMAAISTVADMVPLIGENRTILQYGLIVIQKTRRPGLRALLKNAGSDLRKIDATTIGFHIAPRINAAGRMDHSNAAFFLLREPDLASAETLAAKIEKNNTDRRSATETISQEVSAQLEKQKNESILIAVGQNWPVGLVGLVAGKMVEQYDKPALVITKRGEDFVGSGRSIPEYNLIETLQKYPNLLKNYGGHPAAAGFTVLPEHFEEFVGTLQRDAKEALSGVDCSKQIRVDAEISLSQVDWGLCDWVMKFQPTGQGNPAPLFVSRNISILDIRVMGKNMDHLKLRVREGEHGKLWPAVGFRQGRWMKSLKVGDRVDMVYEISVNEWNGNREIQLIIKDLRPLTSV